MMDASCRDCDDYLDGTLTPPRAAAYEAHLSTCAACRREVEAQTSIEQLLRAGDAQVDAASVVPAVTRRIRRGRIKRAAWVAVAASVVFVPIAAVYLAPRGNRQRRPAPPRIAEQVAPREVVKDPAPVAAPVAWVRTSAATIAVAQESETSNVHIYRILPAANSPRR